MDIFAKSLEFTAAREAMNAGLPMVLYSYVPGQEEGNAAYVVETGAGVWAPGAEATAAAVRRWLARPQDVERASHAARRAARPEAAREIARLLASLMEERTRAPARLPATARPTA